MKLPRLKITIDPQYSDGEDLGISQIAFTATPAIKVKGMAFSANEKKFFADEVKMRIAAPALIPMEIYRCDEDGEYYAEFTEEEIEKLTAKFMANLTNSGKFNLEHNEKNTVPAYILEAWIVNDPARDKAKSSFNIDVPKGTLMIVSQVTDKAYYDSLVAKGQVGFSVEGFLGLKLSEITDKQKNKYTMEGKPTTMPEGSKFEIDGIKYIVKDGKVMTDALEDAVVADTQAAAQTTDTTTDTTDSTATGDTAAATTDDTTTTTTDDTAQTTDTATSTTDDDAAVDEAAIMAIIQPRLEEIYQMIAECRAQIANATPATPAAVPAQMSIHQKMKEVSKFVSEEN